MKKLKTADWVEGLNPDFSIVDEDYVWLHEEISFFENEISSEGTSLPVDADAFLLAEGLECERAPERACWTLKASLRRQKNRIAALPHRLAQAVACDARQTAADFRAIGQALIRDAQQTGDDFRDMGYAFIRDARQTKTDFRRIAQAFKSAVVWVIQTPERTISWLVHLPWREQLAVRQGFLLGAMAGFFVAGSTLWAVSSLPYFSEPAIAPAAIMPPQPVPIVRQSVQPELAWFYIRFPFLSEQVTVHAKNHHTYIVSDSKRHKDYVVQLGQKFRRVETYSAAGNLEVQIFTPGTKKTVWFKGNKIISHNEIPDGNLWMWNTPLWNSTHLKIYSLADLWLDSPYKRYSCAGFVHKFLADAGIHVPILDAWDIAKQPWQRITMDEIEPGDIITIRALTPEHRRFWHHSVTHVGVYIGHGKMIHAATAWNARRAWVRIADVETFHGRIDKILRPPELQ